MNSIKLVVAFLALGALATPTLAQETPSCPAEGPDAPLALHQEWIMEGWERHGGDPAFVFAQKMGKFYDLENPQGVFWDNFAPGDTQLFTDAVSYGANWEDLQNGARSVLHGMTNAHDALVGSDAASSAVGFVGRLERLDGEVLAFDARSQLGWRCVDGAWKIKHELNYAWTVEPDAIEAVLGKRIEP